MKVLTVIGTRPEAIKLAPVIRELERRDGVESVVCVTAQHREMLDGVLSLFGITPAHDLDVMAGNQTPSEVAAAVLARLDPILAKEKPDWVIVQGDTTTTAAAALCAFYRRVKVAHVEAGLRTFDKWRPFPEEVNRKVATLTADLHLAPSGRAKQNLLNEGVEESAIVVTGNPVIDALHWAAELPIPPLVAELERDLNSKKQRLLLVTAHRRENWGEPLENICLALRDLVEARSDIHVVYPVHLNPNVDGPVRRCLANAKSVTLLPPVDYLTLVHLMKRAAFVVTDSGGIQEEAPSLGKPVLVLRDITERPEALAAGTVKVIGVERQRILSEALNLLDDGLQYERMARAVNPYGDGFASGRIVAALSGEKCDPFIEDRPLEYSFAAADTINRTREELAAALTT